MNLIAMPVRPRELARVLHHMTGESGVQILRDVLAARLADHGQREATYDAAQTVYRRTCEALKQAAVRLKSGRAVRDEVEAAKYMRDDARVTMRNAQILSQTWPPPKISARDMAVLCRIMAERARSHALTEEERSHCLALTAKLAGALERHLNA